MRFLFVWCIRLSFLTLSAFLLPTAADLTDLYEHAQMPEIVIETINDYDARGKTPLLYAASVGHLETLMNMLQAGADVNKPAKDTTDTGIYMSMWCGNSSCYHNDFLIHSSCIAQYPQRCFMRRSSDMMYS